MRARQGQTVVDASWAMANQREGRFDRSFLFGATAVAVRRRGSAGRPLGALGGTSWATPHALGLDAIFPAFFLALLLRRAARRPGAWRGAGGRVDRARARPVGSRRGAGPGGQRGGAGRAQAPPCAGDGADERRLWALIAGCAIVTFAIKAAGPVAFGGRALPPWFDAIITLMAPALLAALVVTRRARRRGRLHVGADTAGVAAAGVVIWRGGSIMPAVGLADGGDGGASER